MAISQRSNTETLDCLSDTSYRTFRDRHDDSMRPTMTNQKSCHSTHSRGNNCEVTMAIDGSATSSTNLWFRRPFLDELSDNS